MYNFIMLHPIVNTMLYYFHYNLLTY